MNKSILIGRVVRDFDINKTRNDKSVVNFTLAIDKQMSKEAKEEAEKDGQATAYFISVTAWGKLADSAYRYMGKGSLCAVSARLENRSYTDKETGKTIYTTDVIAESIEFLQDPFREHREAKWKEGN